MYWPYLLVLALLAGMMVFSQRKRRQAIAQDLVRISHIGFGDEVMTTSGLYGTVVARNEDGTVQLAIAPGVEVKWALAALRDAESLPDQYRKGLHDDNGADGARAEFPDDEQDPPRR